LGGQNGTALSDKRKQRLEFDRQTRGLILRFWHAWVVRYWPRLFVAMALMMAVAGTTSLYPLLIRFIFQLYEVRDQPSVNLFGIAVKPDAVVFYIAPLVLAVTTAKGISLYLQTVQTNAVVLRVIRDVQSAMFRHLVRADLARLTRDTTGSLISRFISDVAIIREALMRLVNNLVRDLVTVLALVGTMIWLDWMLALAVLVLYPLIGIPIAALGRRLRKLSANMQAHVGEMTALLDESLSGTRMVKTYGLERYEVKRAEGTFDRLLALMMSQVRNRSWLEPMLEVVGGLAVAGVLVFAGYQITQNHKTIGDFTGFLTALLMATGPARAIGTLNSVIQEGLAAVQRIFTLLDEKPLIENRPDAKRLEAPRGAIAFRAVTFAYGEDSTALDQVSFEIPPGTTAALVGPSGAGKSTIINLIPRLYDVTGGRIEVDGQDIRELTLESLRGAIALVSQDVVLFNDTVRANIAFGRPGASLEAIEEAARAAAADGFIRALPQGYDSIVGEGGTKLSGGQRQRIAIARAMLKNVPILLLDEATSALDSESERQVQEALARLKEGRTTLVIAHRLSTVLDADRIFVLESGHIVDSGSHAELLRKGGLYTRLYATQFQDKDPPAGRAVLTGL
jgi:ATP-binding cassette, subfamily B, bacterial MsbA